VRRSTLLVPLFLIAHGIIFGRMHARSSDRFGQHPVSAGELGHEDPVGLGLVASLARPDGNLTGILFTGELSAKRLEILREMVPGAARVAVLVNPTNPATETTVRDVEAAGASRLSFSRAL
jgi:ABC transporter substrate binding protein